MKSKKSTPNSRKKKVPNRTYAVDLHGIPVTVTRKQMKTMRLRVSETDLAVSLSLPHGFSEKKAMLFLSSREDWIRKTLAELEHRRGIAKRQYESGEPFDLWGIRYTLSVEEGGRRYSLSLSEGEDRIALYRVPPNSTPEAREKHLDEYRKAALEALLDDLFPKWEARTGLRHASHDLRRMKSRWGSCNTATKHIRFNLRLSEHLPICTEYVVLHELCHLQVPNHGAAFHALLDRHLPSWREIRKGLNGR